MTITKDTLGNLEKELEETTALRDERLAKFDAEKEAAEIGVRERSLKRQREAGISDYERTKAAESIVRWQSVKRIQRSKIKNSFNNNIGKIKSNIEAYKAINSAKSAKSYKEAIWRHKESGYGRQVLFEVGGYVPSLREYERVKPLGRRGSTLNILMNNARAEFFNKNIVPPSLKTDRKTAEASFNQIQERFGPEVTEQTVRDGKIVEETTRPATFEDFFDQKGNFVKDTFSELFNRNLEIQQELDSFEPVGPKTISLDQNTPFNLLAERQESILQQRDEKIKELEATQSDTKKLAIIEKELPLFNNRLLEIDKLALKKKGLIDELLETRKPSGPETVTLDKTSGFNILAERQSEILKQREKKLAELDALEDDNLKQVMLQQDIPLFDQRLQEIDKIAGNLIQRTEELREQRQPVKLDAPEPKSFKLKDIVDTRNTLVTKRNLLVDELNALEDPALRVVSIEQDIPQFDTEIQQLDSQIEKGVKFAEERTPLSLGIQNIGKPKKLPKEFSISVGDTKQTFRRNQRGAKQAQQFIQQQKKLKQKDFEKLDDPILKEIAMEQDLPVLELGGKAVKQQSKIIKAEKRQQLESLNLGVPAADFLPFTPADTPTGQLKVPPIPKGGAQAVFSGAPQAFGFDEPARKSGRSAFEDPFTGKGKSFDIGNVFGSSEKVPKARKNEFNFF